MSPLFIIRNMACVCQKLTENIKDKQTNRNSSALTIDKPMYNTPNNEEDFKEKLLFRKIIFLAAKKNYQMKRNNSSLYIILMQRQFWNKIVNQSSK